MVFEKFTSAHLSQIARKKGGKCDKKLKQEQKNTNLITSAFLISLCLTHSLFEKKAIYFGNSIYRTVKGLNPGVISKKYRLSLIVRVNIVLNRC